MITIDEKTKIPLFAGFIAAASLVGFIFWLSSLYSMAVQANTDNVKQDKTLEKLDMLYEIKQDVAVIKEKLIKQGK